jgi:hypothetical protein
MYAASPSKAAGGADGPEAWAIAESWNQKWQAVRKGQAPAPIEASKLSRDDAEAVRRYPPGSVGAAFQAYIRTPEWAARAASARNKVWWPAWFRIREMWGDVAPDTITFAQMSKWRAALEKKHGRGVAHKTIRVWRTFWKIMLGMKVARTPDPTLGIRNRAPAPRWQRWSEGEGCPAGQGRMAARIQRPCVHHRRVLGYAIQPGGCPHACGAPPRHRGWPFDL